MKSLQLIGTVALAASAAVAQPPTRMPIPVHVYTDPSLGLSFQYPQIWNEITTAADIWGSLAFDLPGAAGRGVPIRFAVQFSPKGNLYEQTTLVSLNYLYGRIPGTSAASCRGIVTRLDPRATAVNLNGITFTHGAGGDAGMGQSLTSQVYSTWRDGNCLIFEEEFHQTTGVTRPGQRRLTATETQSLQRHLDAISETIRLHAKP